jgi:hypothetical protein
MTLTANTYPAFDLAALQAKINLGSDTMKVMLLNPYTYSNGHSTMADVKAAGTEVTGAGYTAGGLTVTSVTATKSGFVVTATCANPAWTAATISASDAVFYDAQGGSDALNIPWVHWSFGAVVASSAGTFTLVISGSGLKTNTGS